MTYTHPITPHDTYGVRRETLPNPDALRAAVKAITGARVLIEGVSLTAYDELGGEELSDLGTACSFLNRAIAELERA